MGLREERAGEGAEEGDVDGLVVGFEGARGEGGKAGGEEEGGCRAWLVSLGGVGIRCEGVGKGRRAWLGELMGLEDEKGFARLLLSLGGPIVVPTVGWTYSRGEGVFGYNVDLNDSSERLGFFHCLERWVSLSLGWSSLKLTGVAIGSQLIRVS